jgi:hypothetical protein
VAECRTYICIIFAALLVSLPSDIVRQFGCPPLTLMAAVAETAPERVVLPTADRARGTVPRPVPTVALERREPSVFLHVAQAAEWRAPGDLFFNRADGATAADHEADSEGLPIQFDVLGIVPLYRLGATLSADSPAVHLIDKGSIARAGRMTLSGDTGPAGGAATVRL